MTSPLASPLPIATQDPTTLQNQASNPDASVWVDASAGTGKTKVLTDRVLRFLLQGVKPHKILCLTFTKAAAAEMQSRLFHKLSTWATQESPPLQKELQTLLGQDYHAASLPHARQLFFQLLDDPYGIQILTLHSFCQKILQRFPLEAGLEPHATLIEQSDQITLIDSAYHTLLKKLPTCSDLSTAFEKVSEFYQPLSLGQLLQEVLLDPHSRRHLSTQNLEDLKAHLEGYFGFSLQACESTLYATYSLPDSLKEAVDVFSQGSPSDQKTADSLAAFLNAPHLSKESFQDYCHIFFTAKGEPRKKAATKKVLDQHPWIADFFLTEIDGLEAFKATVQNYECLQVSWSVTLLCHHLLTDYTALKSQKSLLDFEDIIQKTAALLAQENGASWVLYKLDGGVDHILVDEAQDTSPDQWKTILHLCEDFFAGKSKGQENRTLFVVGDRKQSIYSFQGAEPDLFQNLRHYFQERIEKAQKNFTEVSLNVSFRSCQAVLDLVNKTLKTLSPDQRLDHQSFRPLDAGKVSVWPLMTVMDESDPPQNHSASKRLATKIAQTISQDIHTQKTLPALGRPVHAGDYMVLVQRRSAFMYQLIRALKQLKIPVAGPDRFNMLDHIAVQDLLALANFLLLPEDSYALACTLKSPLFNLNDDHLIELTNAKSHLWAQLNSLKDQEPYATAYTQLSTFLKLTDNLSPFELFHEILTTYDGRKKFLGRLGDDTQDVLDAFMNLAFQFHQKENGGLQQFVHFCEKTNPEIKRDFSSADLKAVRVMTVHGAKGLQAPIVYLPDTTRVPSQMPLLTWTHDPDQNTLPIWNAPSTYNASSLVTTPKEHAKHKSLEEYYRLLYVALTRAEHELIVTGWETEKKLSDDCWYQQIEAAFADLGAACNDAETLTYEQPQRRPVQKSADFIEIPTQSKAALPGWLFEKVPSAPGEADPKSPSTYLAKAKPVQSALDVLANASVSKASAKGTFVHKLLEDLPQLDRTAWPATISSLAQEYDVDPQDSLIQDTLTLLDSPAMQDLFSDQSYAEVNISGTAFGEKFNAQIDRLIITDSTLRVIDFKTNNTVPENLAEVPSIYLAQLAIYQELLKNTYPTHKIICELIWVRKQLRQEIPPSMLEQVTFNKG